VTLDNSNFDLLKFLISRSEIHILEELKKPVGYIFKIGILFFSSPELKAQVSFSDRPLSGVHLSVRLSVRL
jgi:hypothetical protein